MPDALFLFGNPADNATITASSEEAAFPVENLQITARSEVWRSAAGTSSYLDITFAATQAVGVLAFVDLNLTTGGTITVQAYSDFIGGTLEYEADFSPTVYRFDQTQYQYGQGAYGVGPYSLSTPLGSQRNRQITIIELPDNRTERYWRITFTDANTAYQQLARLYMTLPTRQSVNLSYGWNARRVERSPIKESLGGQKFVQRRDSRLLISGSFDWLTDNERTNLLLTIEEFGEVEPVIFSVTPENSNEGLTTSVYGVLQGVSLTHRNFLFNSMPFSVLEEF